MQGRGVKGRGVQGRGVQGRDVKGRGEKRRGVQARAAFGRGLAHEAEEHGEGGDDGFDRRDGLNVTRHHRGDHPGAPEEGVHVLGREGRLVDQPWGRVPIVGSSVPRGDELVLVELEVGDHPPEATKPVAAEERDEDQPHHSEDTRVEDLL